MIRQEVLSAEIGQMIYDARTKAGLTQQQLANRLGTTQSVISRLESANYEGHSLSMLQRIAEVLGQKLELRLSAAAEEASPLIRIASRVDCDCEKDQGDNDQQNGDKRFHD